MKVTLDQNLESFLREQHQDTISLELDMHVGHNNEFILSKPTEREPRLLFARPSQLDDYDEYHVDEFTVFVAKEVKADKEMLEIKDQVFNGVHTCFVKGWKGE